MFKKSKQKREEEQAEALAWLMKFGGRRCLTCEEIKEKRHKLEKIK